MDFLFDNPLANMRGEVFLLFYIFVVVCGFIFLSVAKFFLDQTDKLNTPQISSNIDPLEIAFLRGGRNEATRSVVFSLLQKGFIAVQIVGKASQIKRVASQKSIAGLSQIEKDALEVIGFSTEPKDLFNANGLSFRLDNYWNNYQARLEKQQFLATGEMKAWFFMFRMLSIIFLLALAAYKVLAAIVHGRENFMILVVLAVISTCVIAFLAKPPRLTKLGKRYLDKLKTAFGNLQNNPTTSYNSTAYTSQPAFGGIDPMLLSVGVFGTGVLAGTAFGDYNEAFRKAQQSSSGSCGAGCGSSCSSSDGGSGCGGGCGGCGGGD